MKHIFFTLLYPRLFIGISFTPHGIGDHLANVYRNGKHIPNSPFKFSISESEIGTASKVKASGLGLNEGMANELSEFVVNAKDAGCGGLSVTIEGRLRRTLNVLTNKMDPGSSPTNQQNLETTSSSSSSLMSMYQVGLYQWISTRLPYFQCISNGNTLVLLKAIGIQRMSAW